MKGMRFLVVLWALVLTACGDGSVQSPGFTPVLLSFAVCQNDVAVSSCVVGSPDATAPAGREVKFKAVGEFSVFMDAEATGVVPVDAKWTSDNTAVATINASTGVAKAVSAGVATFTAKKDGFEGTIKLTVTPAVIDKIDIVLNSDTANATVANDTIATGGQKVYRAVATFSDGTRPDAAVFWTSSDATVAVPTPPSAQATTTKTITVPSTVEAGNAAIITVSLASDTDIKATLNIGVVASSLQSLSDVTLDPASPISAGLTTQAVAIGANPDGSTMQIANDSITWTSSNTDVATVDATGRVTTIKVGNTNIVATLKTGTYPLITDTSKRTALEPLAVTDAACTTPLRSPDATATPSTALLCIGCSVTNPGFAIDLIDTNHADLSIPVGLLTASVSLNIKSPVEFPMGTKTGFIVGRPSGDLVSAELLSQVILSTTNAAGDVVETFTNSPSGPLVVDLLGTSIVGGINDKAVISADATKPFTGITLTYSSGVLTALGSLQVYNACGTVKLPE